MMNLTVITEISVGLLLLSLRLLIGNGYQEEVIENNLLDYIENRFKNPEKTARIIPLGKIRKKEILNTEEKVRENVAGKIEQGILETAATDSRYKHLLNKEEEEIVKDVIKEFLT